MHTSEVWEQATRGQGVFWAEGTVSTKALWRMTWTRGGRAGSPEWSGRPVGVVGGGAVAEGLLKGSWGLGILQ